MNIRKFSLWFFAASVVFVVVLVMVAGCTIEPEPVVKTGTVGVYNLSSYDIHIYLDGDYKGLLPSGYYEDDEIPVGEHTLFGTANMYALEWGPLTFILTEAGLFWSLYD